MILYLIITLLVVGDALTEALEETCPYLRQFPAYDTIFIPCPALSENCIRSFLVTHSTCTPVYGAAPDTLYDKPRPLLLPLASANMSFIWQGVPRVRGLNNGTFKTFYVNRITRNIVLELEFDEIATYTPEAAVKYYFKGREPVRQEGFFGIVFKKYSLTATIEIDPYTGIKWDDKEVYSYFGDSDIPAAIDPLLYGTSPITWAACQSWKDNFNTAVKEASVRKSRLYFDRFIESRLCKF